MTAAAALSSSRGLLGYELCIGSGLPAENGRPNATVSGIVCLAFSVELAIKSLLMSAAQPAHGHRLDALFYELPQADQQAIMAEIGMEPQVLQEQLTVAANAFVEWRYIYESPGRHSINAAFLVAFSMASIAIAQRHVSAKRKRVAR